jgi:DNA-binding transcriptional LysR family regulator
VPAHVARGARGAVGHVVALLVFGRALEVEGAEHRGLGAAGGLVVVHGDGQHRQAQHVRQQDELLALVVALLAGGREVLDALEPLGLGELHLAREGVQVLHQAGHDLVQARIGRVGEAREHGLRDVVLVQVAHRGVSMESRVTAHCRPHAVPLKAPGAQMIFPPSGTVAPFAAPKSPGPTKVRAGSPETHAHGPLDRNCPARADRRRRQPEPRGGGAGPVERRRQPPPGALEDRLGARLVERNTRRLYLTDTGREFCGRARKAILADLADAESTVNATALNPTGVLRVTASLSFSIHHIAPLLREYTQRYPGVTVHVEAANRYFDLIDNNIDVAIRTREYEPDSNITIRRLGETRRILAASPRYLAQHGFPKTLDDLARHKLLIYTHANNPNELRFSRGGETRTVSVTGLLDRTTARCCAPPRSTAWASWCSRPTSSTRTSWPAGWCPRWTTGTCRT